MPSPSLEIQSKILPNLAATEVDVIIAAVVDVISGRGEDGIALDDHLQSTAALCGASTGVQATELWHRLLSLPHIWFSIDGRSVSSEDPKLQLSYVERYHPTMRVTLDDQTTMAEDTEVAQRKKSSVLEKNYAPTVDRLMKKES